MSTRPARYAPVRSYIAVSVLTVAALIAVDILHRFHPAWALAGAFDDDFFYYAGVARHMAQGAHSTFDGIHPTNGYHPLWLLILTLFSLTGSTPTMLALVTAATIASIAAIWFLSRRIASGLGAPAPAQHILATLLTFQAELLIRGGMEIVLAVPLILLLVERYLAEDTYDRAFFFRAGLLSSLCVLARLDSILLALLLFGFAASQLASVVSRLKATGAFVLGLTPLWCYLLSNIVRFGSVTPISAQAKQLRLHRLFEIAPLISLIHPLTAVRALVALPGLLSAVLLVTLLLLHGGRLPSRTRIVLWPLAVFPLIHLALLCGVSDWPLWYWYFYPFLPVLLALPAVVAGRTPDFNRMSPAFAALVAAVIFGYTFAYNHSHPPQRNALFLAAQDIAGFARTHPGVYAMGDRSGTAGFEMSSPMIQLEGLTMDRTYLEKLRKQPTLNAVLNDYGVTYYVSTNAAQTGGCYRTEEPAQAGPDSVHMAGSFCSQPVFTSTHGGFTTRILALHPTKRP